MRRAAAHGALAWTAYAITAAAFYFVAPRFSHPDSSVLTPWHLRYSLILIGVYAAAGAAGGCVIWRLLEAVPGRLPRGAGDVRLASAAGTISLALAITLNYVPWPYRKLALLLFGINLLLLGLVFIAAFHLERRGGWWPQTGPWVYSFLVIGIPWAIERLYQTQTGESLAVAAALGGALAVAVFCRWAATAAQIGTAWGPVRTQAAGVLALAVCAGMLALVAGPGREQWLSPPSPAHGERTSPDIVLITLDTVRADHTSLAEYERDTTPNLRRLAESATVYPRAVAVSNMTLSTHASIFTGLYPRRHGANYHRPDHRHGRPLSEHFETITERLSGQGYVTAALVANNGYLRAAMGFAQGFDLFDSRALARTQVRPPFRMLHERWKGRLDAFAGAESQRTFLRASEINDRAGRVLDRMAAAGAPFFLFLNYMDAHDPLLPPAPFDSLYPGKDPSFTQARYEQMMFEVMNLEREPTPEESATLTSQYDGAIAYMDSEIAKLIAKLKSIGRFENTILIVTSDHGEAFGRQHTIQHGFFVYQNEIGIPLVIKYPGQDRAEIDASLVSQVDIAPTILTAAGLAPAGVSDGRALQGGNQRSGGYVISQSFQHPRSDDFDERFQVRQTAILSGSNKFVRSTSGRREFYDLREDPAENRNILAGKTAEAQALEARLDGWFESVAPAVIPGNQATDEETLQRLRSLGYIQ